MRMSCNGCRVLRKGCSDNCSIRPCLQWLKSPDSQANATLFLAKFYGRAGLLNLINAGPDHLRPAIFRSLLYEACGRMVNPVYGSAGLLWSGNWQHCQAAVEATLRGDPIIPLLESQSGDCGLTSPSSKPCDIRHLSPTDLRRVKNRIRFKRTNTSSAKSHLPLRIMDDLDFRDCAATVAPPQTAVESDSVSVETVEETLVAVKGGETAEGSDVELELTLALDPWRRRV